MATTINPGQISRECGYVMRGMAIVAIVLHNYCHFIPGVTKENEFKFFYSNLESFASTHDSFLQWMFDLFSFLGWYGVPTFMFLTGYGLVMKYERDNAPFSAGGFLKQNFFKLLFLMLPGIITLTIGNLALELLHGNFGVSTMLEYLAQLTLLPDIIFPWLPPRPGVYWYFGLTMEFYLIYALLIRHKPQIYMWLVVALSLAMQLIADPESQALEWMRHNIIGWASVFVMGVVYGRARQWSGTVKAIAVVTSVLLFLPSLLNHVTWQFSILACVVISIVAAKLSMKIGGWRQCWIWIGQLSPMLFVAHPVARTIILNTLAPSSPSLLPLSLYLCLTFALAYLFQFISSQCRRSLVKK